MTRAPGWWRRSLVAAAGVVVACARGAPLLPTGAGAPAPGFAEAHAQAVAECRAVRTFSALVGLSGRAGRVKLRGNIAAGFASPEALRLEAIALGRPVFVLVARDGDSTLLLPRDRRVLRGAPPDEILEALAGLPVGPAELRSVVSGCGLAFGEPGDGRSYSGGWLAGDAGDATTYMRQIDGRWRVMGARRSGLSVAYEDFRDGRPATIRVRHTADGGGIGADLTMRLSQVDINVPLDDAVFRVEVPPDAEPITLDELRRAGPLGGGA